MLESTGCGMKEKGQERGPFETDGGGSPRKCEANSQRRVLGKEGSRGDGPVNNHGYPRANTKRANLDIYGDLVARQNGRVLQRARRWIVEEKQEMRPSRAISRAVMVLVMRPPC